MFLISKQDILEYRDISYSMDEAELNTYIREAQNQDLKPVLNPYLFNDFLKSACDSSSPMYAEYQDLLNGTEYDDGRGLIQFDGVKPMLVYFTYARIVQKSTIKTTRTGLVIKDTTESTSAPTEDMQSTLNGARSLAISYQDQVCKFLEDNKDIYTLWDRSRESEIENTKSFSFVKAQRIENKYQPSYRNRLW